MDNVNKNIIKKNNYNKLFRTKKNKLKKNINIFSSKDSLMSSNHNNSKKPSIFNDTHSIDKKAENIFNIESTHSSKNNKNDKNKKHKKEKYHKIDKIIVDNIDNIYTNISKLPNKLLKQRVFLLIISFYVSSIHWFFLFLTKRKMENDYCYTKYNQFEVCYPDQFCSMNVIGKNNYFIYDDTFDIHNNSLNSHENFMEEMKVINENYKPFFVNYFYLVSKKKLFLLKDKTKKNIDKYNFVILLTKKEKWNLFLKYYSICERNMYYFYIIGIIFMGGLIGSIIFGTFADIYGRKKLIIITLFIVTLSFIFMTIICIRIEEEYYISSKKFQKNYISSKNNTNYEILSKHFTQRDTQKIFRSYSVLFMLSIFLLSLGLRPLSKISLALLLENSTSELRAIQNFRRFTFITTALPPFIIGHAIIITNNSLCLFIFFTISFFILFVCSFFVLNESIRHLYEYCEWKELTKEILNLFKISDIISINFMDKMEFQYFVLKENKVMYENSFKANNCSNIAKTKYDIIKKRILSLSRDIKRNSLFIIKKSEVKFNPYIIHTCLKSNRLFMNSKYLLFILLFIIYFQEYFVEKEILEIPFFKLSDLYFDINNNILINSNFLILGIILFMSNYFYYFFYRISSFYFVLNFSLIIITVLFIIYHYIVYISDDFPVDLSQFSFASFDLPHIRDNNYKTHIILIFIEFFLNGIIFYINILLIKLSKTLYRCTFFGINSILFLASIGIGDIIMFQIKRYFFLIGSLNLIGIFCVIFLGEFKNIRYLINDLKQKVDVDNKLKKG